jgi:hypothetical protein
VLQVFPVISLPIKIHIDKEFPHDGYNSNIDCSNRIYILPT